MIQFACTSCRRTSSAPDNRLGRPVACPHCGARVTVPLPAEERTPAGTPDDAESLEPPVPPLAAIDSPAVAELEPPAASPPSWVLAAAIGGFAALVLLGAVTIAVILAFPSRHAQDAQAEATGAVQGQTRPSAPLPPLTSEQRERWDKFRRAAMRPDPNVVPDPKDADRRYQVFGCMMKDGQVSNWPGLGEWDGKENWNGGVPVRRVSDGRGNVHNRGTIRLARESAEQIADRYASKYMMDYLVIVNLYEHPDPQVHQWVFMRDGQLQRTKAAPADDLADSLARHLAAIQKGQR